MAYIVEFIVDYTISRPSLSDLHATVEGAMAAFNAAEAKERAEVQANRNVPDEDGFVTVHRRGRKANTDGTGATVFALSSDQAAKLKPKDAGLVDFYRFQMREAKRSQLSDLRKRFEADKAKIAEMKEMRKFKPY